MRLRRADRDDCCALGADEVTVVIDPPPVAVGVKLADEQDARVVAMLAPVRQQRFDRALLGDRQVGAVEVGRLEQDIEVADGPEARRDLAQAVAIALRTTRPERRAEDTPRGTLATGSDAHRMELLGISPEPRPRLASEHPREVEAHHLPASLGNMI